MPDLDTVRAERLRRTLAAVATAHPFYRARFHELGLSPGDIRSLDDVGAPVSYTHLTLPTIYSV